ncbi:ABC transporter permease [Micromonospora sp. CA-248089]|uniref:ABC transporter permease n=1 Tax=Micromonospora sp. CA-248089 TaxID=3239960 RepID=UPI003D911A18
MSRSFAGTAVLARFAVRRDRLQLLLSTVALPGITALALPTFAATYTNDAQRQQRADLMRTPVGVFFGGPGYGLGDYTIGPMAINEIMPIVLLVLAVINILTVIRHTRTEEQTGRAELVRANAVGRRAPITAGLIACLVANMLIGAAIALVLLGRGLPVADCLAVGVGVTLTGLVFAAIAAVLAQVTESSRSAMGLSVVVMAVLYLVRVSGDIAAAGGTPSSWVSPTTWFFQTRPFVELRWWPLLVPVLAIAALVPLAYALAARRDVGAGLVAPRRGPADAAARLRSPRALALRLQRGPIIAWTLAAVLLGFFYGSLGGQVESMVQENPDTVRAIGNDALNVTDGFFATMLIYVSVLSSVLAITSVSRMRNEERAGRGELVLATAVSRLRWMRTVLGVAAVFSSLAQIAGGVALALSSSAALADPALVGTLVAATFNYLPIPLMFAALSALLLGLSARATPVIWLIFAGSVFITLFSGFAQLPGWLSNFSVFNLPALVPLDPVDVVPLAGMAVAVVLAGIAALALFGRRDLATTA